MTKILDRAGLGVDISASQNDANLSSLAGINEAITAATHTIDVNDQNRTIEYNRGTAIAVTLPSIASVTGSNIHTDDFKVTLKNLGVGTVTATKASTDTFDDTTTAQVLKQFEWMTIQTDNSLGLWNIIARGKSTILFADAAAGTIITTGDATAAEVGNNSGMTSGTTMSYGDWATGTKVIATNAGPGFENEAEVTIGLGSTDMDFGYKVTGSLQGGLVSAIMMDENGYIGPFVGPSENGSVGYNSITTPATTKLMCRVQNDLGTGQDITVKWWARIR